MDYCTHQNWHRLLINLLDQPAALALSLSRLVVVAALFICLLCLAWSCERVDGQIMHKGLLKATNATRQTKHANVQELIVATFCFDV
jgi:hypothetical protein